MTAWYWFMVYFLLGTSLVHLVMWRYPDRRVPRWMHALVDGWFFTLIPLGLVALILEVLR